MMNLKAIFKKPLDRKIEGVIKADDEASLRLEFEEYVLTNEVEQRLETFLDAYNNYEGANGVWISGFFGSGKSHLLKILALLLENRDIDGVPARELFLPKTVHNEILSADLKRSIAIPAKSILFNIDQKADVISKTQLDALLAVFVKVFDEMCGYYGKQGHIAKFERDLDSRGLYSEFKKMYEQQAGRSWHLGREQALLEASNIAQAYGKVTGDERSAIGILDKYRTDYRVSIEDFADQVKAYIDQQVPDFRLNFFIDEVGQYIADNVKLMTNLQTIAESLATKCHGGAWVIVTSQNDMSTVLGEMNQQQSNDFSKIMARFETKMLLTSTNVAEVIQKRLLAKNDTGAELVSDLYHQEANNFGTLFSFTDGSRNYKLYRDRDEFIRSYPFIPYQFELFQSAIENLSTHNAFEGKHSSVGERSMLGVFQQVAMKISDYEVGQIASFDLMYEGIHTALKAQTQKSILTAERQLDNKFAVKLLKALFLVKYVKEFKPTLHNLVVLMLDQFNQDLPKLRSELEEAITLLERQTYIQRNGELYEYLTDEEKDIEREIKNTDVETNDIATELDKIIFERIINTRKIRYKANQQDYPYSRKLDERLQGREYELAIHLITPFHENVENESLLIMQSMGRNELLVVMPPDRRLYSDMILYRQTEKYIRQNISITQREAVKRILMDKGSQNRQRYQEIEQLVRELLGKAKLFVESNKIEISSEDPTTRIIHGFHELISRVYPNLRMLPPNSYSETDIAKCLKNAKDGLFGAGDAASLAESEQELLAFIQSNNRGGVRTTIKSLMEKFERKPYGWYYAAILCTLAKLCARGKVEIRSDSNILEDAELERALRNSHGHANSYIDPQIEFTTAQVRALKEFYEDFFDAPPQANEARALGKETGGQLQAMLHTLTPLVAQSQQYPLLNILTPVIEQLQAIIDKPYTWYLTELLRQEDELLDMKEQIIDPIRKFMQGSQRKIFDNAYKFTREQEPNFAYITNDDFTVWETNTDVDIVSPVALNKALLDPNCFKGTGIQQIKKMVDYLQAKVTSQLGIELTHAKHSVTQLQERLCSMPEFSVLTSERQQQIIGKFNEFSNSIKRQTLIAVIRDTLHRFENQVYPKLLAQLSEPAKPTQTADRPATGKSEPPMSLLPISTIKIDFAKAWLADEADVENYVDLLRKAMLKKIDDGKRIQI